jgi:glutamyl-tRNA reductase
MVQSKFINNGDYDLKERETLFKEFSLDKSVAHVLLSTCNRVELYWGEGSVPENMSRHLFRVAAGLESSLLGERAIQGQIKQAYSQAQESYRLSSGLNRLFQSAMHVGKRVRTETKIAEGAVSHSQVTANILKGLNIDLNQKVICIIGMNKLTEDILKYLSSRGATNVFLSNRNFEKAQQLASEYDASAVTFEKKQALLDVADVVISATSAPHLIVKEKDVAKDKELVIFDLAFPRDVAEEIGKYPLVKLYNLEDIERFAKRNLSVRTNEVERAEEIIEEELAKFYQWQEKANFNVPMR